MDDMMYRRRMLLSQLGRLGRFMIFYNGWLRGDIKDSEHSEIGSRCIDVKGYRNFDVKHNSKGYFKYYQEPDSGPIHYDKPMNTVASLTEEYQAMGYTYSTSKQAWTFHIEDTDENTLTVHWYTDLVSHYPGFITIGSYDFTKYKTLNFTVEEYQGKGTVSFGDFSEEITAIGSYSINVKDYKGDFNIKFSSDSSSGYSVNNVYLDP
jgi:hypothetical protein